MPSGQKMSMKLLKFFLVCSSSSALAVISAKMVMFSTIQNSYPLSARRIKMNTPEA